MEYRFNEERNRIDEKLGSPCFFKAVYKNQETGEERGLYLYARANVERHKKTVAENWMETGESLTGIYSIPRAQFESWLLPEPIVLNGEELPKSFVLDYLVAKNFPTYENRDTPSGNLLPYKERLEMQDGNLYEELWESYEKTKPEQDVVREMEL